MQFQKLISFGKDTDGSEYAYIPGVYDQVFVEPFEGKWRLRAHGAIGKKSDPSFDTKDLAKAAAVDFAIKSLRAAIKKLEKTSANK